MTTLHMNLNPLLARELYGPNQAPREPVMVFDVGCSGGLEYYWSYFGTSLRAVGFDPLVAEISRLNNSVEGGSRYEAARVGWSGYDELFPKNLRQDAIKSRSNLSYNRTSAVAYQQLTQHDHATEVFNRGEPLIYSDRVVDLDSYASAAGMKKIDFLKIDTDGADIEVLLGSKNLLTAGCLGVSVEAQFHGPCHQYANTFGNIDRLMREWGFTLFDLEPFFYTRSALPGPFYYDFPAQTRCGAVQWSEAVYARDLADPDYTRKHGYSPSGEDILKLAAFFDIFGLQDCAAEVLLNCRRLVEPLADVRLLLDRLTPNTLGNGLSYDQYMAAFHSDPAALLPSRLKARHPEPDAPEQEVEALLKRISNLKEGLNADRKQQAEASRQVGILEEMLNTARKDEEASKQVNVLQEIGTGNCRKVAELERALAEAMAAEGSARLELNTLKNSRSWRLTAPLRAVANLARRRLENRHC